MKLHAIIAIARTVLLEAVRRREVYVVVVAATALIGSLFFLRFFDLDGVAKFYREVALKVMSASTAVAAIVLAARQLPREFEQRTIYPLLARPVSRTTFLLGKLTGVLAGSAFCFALFMVIFAAGTLLLGAKLPWVLFLQFIYLQLWMIAVVCALSFWLSLRLSLDAAITIGILLYVFGATFMSLTTGLYDQAGPAAQTVIRVLTWVIPQLALFDLTEKAVHAEFWTPLGWGTLLQLTVYGAFYAALFTGLALLQFRRKPL
jgi:Cu-processing system permease protein